MEADIYCPPENIEDGDLIGYLDCWNNHRGNGKLFALFLELKYNLCNLLFLVYCPPYLWDKFLTYHQSNGIYPNYNQITYAFELAGVWDRDDDFCLIAYVLYNHKLLTDHDILTLCITHNKSNLLKTLMKELSLQCDDKIKVTTLLKECYDNYENSGLLDKYHAKYCDRTEKSETEMTDDEFDECLDYAFVESFKEFSQSKHNVLPDILSLLSDELSKREVVKSVIKNKDKFEADILSNYFDSIIAS
jgi:hypothetical protein